MSGHRCTAEALVVMAIGAAALGCGVDRPWQDASKNLFACGEGGSCEGGKSCCSGVCVPPGQLQSAGGCESWALQAADAGVPLDIAWLHPDGGDPAHPDGSGDGYGSAGGDAAGRGGGDAPEGDVKADLWNDLAGDVAGDVAPDIADDLAPDIASDLATDLASDVATDAEADDALPDAAFDSDEGSASDVEIVEVVNAEADGVPDSALDVDPADALTDEIAFDGSTWDSEPDVIPSDGAIAGPDGDSEEDVESAADTEPDAGPPDLCAGATCDDGNPCTDDTCNPLAGCQHAPNASSCDDNDPCSTSDACSEGVCGGVPLACDDANPCTEDSCSLASKGCVHVPNAATCDDADACTIGDICNAGACQGGPPTVCDDANPCTDDTCDPLVGCQHAPNAAPCNDANACNVGDVCGGGVCAGGGALSCDDTNPCTDDACEPATGCAHTNNSATAPCYDGPDGTIGKGACHGGTRSCKGGALGACLGEVTPTTEVCDGADDDCDGATDESDPALGAACDSNADSCKAGTWYCAAGKLSCGGDTLTAGVACDGNGDGCATVTSSCLAGTQVLCPAEVGKAGDPCDSNGDGCKFGKLSCSSNALVCLSDVACATGLTCEQCACPSGTYDSGGVCADLHEWVLWKVAGDGLPDANYEDLGNGTVKDLITGLVWQQVLDSGTYSWSAMGATGSAQAYCKTLALEGGGWRLPTSNELMSLVDYTKPPPGPTINAKAFPGTPAEVFWTATPLFGASTHAWYVGFDEGIVYGYGITGSYRVRCVR